MKSPAKEGFAMANTESVSGQRDRSPAYPVVPLEIALTRLTEFETHFKRTPARSEKIGEAWGIKAKAYADRIAAALRYFGLLEYQSGAVSGASRYVIVSNEGRKYLRSQQEETRREVVKAAALRPKQIAKFWTEWGPDRPADAAAIDQLTLKNGFSDVGARDFLKVYDATIAFAKLKESDKVTVAESESESADAEDIAGTPNGKMENEADSQSDARQLLDESPTSVQYPKAKSRMLQEIFNLDEGPVTLSFPSDLSPASFQDLQAYLQLFLRKTQRRAGAGDYFAEIYAPDGIKAKLTRYFDDFDGLKEFLEEFKKELSGDILRVHLPARASDEQRRIVVESGAKVAF
jgi:hypothetical protein